MNCPFFKICSAFPCPRGDLLAKERLDCTFFLVYSKRDEDYESKIFLWLLYCGGCISTGERRILVLVRVDLALTMFNINLEECCG
jgi:hypothetical protein